MNSIINTNKVDTKNQPMFFGSERLSVQRYDKPKYSNILNMYKQQIAYLWRPEEINTSKDKLDFNSLQDHEKWMFTKNLQYQILLDSIQSRGINNLLAYCTNTEIEAFCKIWEYVETLHSYSYTYVINSVYTNPSIIYDNIMDDPEILKRAGSVTKYYDSLINEIENNDYATEEESIYAKKKALYLTLVSINILEGIRFYVSFACSFAFAENKKMTGNAKIISLIARDEALHMGFTSYILKMLEQDESEGFKDIVNECKDLARKMYEDAANEEIEWAQYLFKDGSMIGLNAEILIEYMKYLTNSRARIIGLNNIFDKTKNPINWINNWTESKSVQEAPQEEQIISYTVGAFNQDMDDTDYSDLI